MSLRFFSFVSVLALAFAATAHADTITFSLNNSACSSGCNVLPAGTVTLTQNGLNNVLVTVQLTTDYSFRQAPDANHQAFVFDLSGVTGAAVSGVTSGPTSQTFTFSGPGSFRDAGLGANFQYAFVCTTCSPGVPEGPTQQLMFDLTGTGLTTMSFVSNGTNFFGVDVVGIDQAAGFGLTGNIGATDPGRPTPSTVPEPSSLVLLGTGLLGAAGVGRRRILAMVGRG